MTSDLLLAFGGILLFFGMGAILVWAASSAIRQGKGDADQGQAQRKA